MAPGSRATARALSPEDPGPNRTHCSLGTGTARGGESAAAPPTMGACCHRFPPPGALPCRVAISSPPQSIRKVPGTHFTDQEPEGEAEK